MRPPLALPGLVVSLVLVAAACGSSEGTTLDASPTSTAGTGDAVLSSESTTSEVGPSSTVTSVRSEPTTTTAVCPTVDLPVGDSSVPVSTDLDADGTIDTAYMVNGSPGWQLVIELGGGGTVVTSLVGTNDFDQPEVIGGADLDGDGADELAVRVANGAYVALVSFVRVRDCSAIQLAFEDDSPAIFASGASAGGGEALVCNGDGTLERFFFSWLPGEDDETVEYEAGFQPFRIDGDVVVAFPGDGAGLTEDEVNALELFDCLDLELIP